MFGKVKRKYLRRLEIIFGLFKDKYLKRVYVSLGLGFEESEYFGWCWNFSNDKFRRVGF